MGTVYMEATRYVRYARECESCLPTSQKLHAPFFFPHVRRVNLVPRDASFPGYLETRLASSLRAARDAYRASSRVRPFRKEKTIKGFLLIHLVWLDFSYFANIDYFELWDECKSKTIGPKVIKVR